MIEIKVQFWTNNIAKGRERILPKHCWGSGMLRVEANESHGLKAEKPVPFHSLLDMPAAIEKAFVRHRITIHPSQKMRKYIHRPR